MANTLIQIKYSDTNSAPTLLNVAEQGYSYVSNTLFIGTENSDGVIAIGGQSEIVRLNAVHEFANTINAALANVSTLVQPAFDKANSANVLAQQAFDRANTKLDSSGGTLTGTLNISGGDIQFATGGAILANYANNEITLTANVISDISGFYAKEAGISQVYANTNIELITNTSGTPQYFLFNSDGSLTLPANGTISGLKDLNITGNLTVTGNTVYANTQTVLIKDNIITLNAAINQTSAPTSNAGFEIDRGASANASLLWDETNDKWVYFDGNTYFTIADAARLDSAFVRANNSLNVNAGGTVTGNLTITGNLTTNTITAGNGSGGIIAGANVVYSNVFIANTGGYFQFADGSVLTTAIDQYVRDNANAAFSKANSANVLAQNAYNAANNVYGNTVVLGANTTGLLVSNAVTLTTATTVTNGLAQINQILGKLVPQSPGNFPNATSLSVSTLSTYRMTSFTQTDRTTTASKQAAAGATVTSVRRAAAYTTNIFNDVGPGESGTLTLVKNNVATGAVTFTASSANGTYSDLIVSDSKDYAQTGAISYTNFWRSFDAQGSGTVANGWNEIYLSHSGGSNTSTVSWYYDDSAPGTPTFANASIVPSSTTVIYSSTVPHYTSATTFLLGVNVSKLSGDMYPVSNTFFTGTAGGAFAAPASNTYPAVGITSMARNYLVSSGSIVVNTTSTIIAGFGSSATGPSVTVDNSYATGSQVFTTALANTVLYKTGTANALEETTITFGSTVGVGSGTASRIINPGTTDTPAYTASATLFNSQTGTLTANDATIVAGTLKHDQVNYASGYLPVGPNLSTGRTGAQYFTFKFVRTSVSKFDIQFTGTIAGMWVALPGSAIDTAAAATNGWIDMSLAYGGSGVPSSGASVGGTVTLNSAVTNHRKTCTFGTVSSSSTSTNEIYVRIKLTSGQTVTALTLQSPTN